MRISIFDAEDAVGEGVDTRQDVFLFGCVDGFAASKYTGLLGYCDLFRSLHVEVIVGAVVFKIGKKILQVQ